MPDVVVSLVGNLGNQLFQFAAAKSLQADPDEPVVLDPRIPAPWHLQLDQVVRPEAFRLATRRDLLQLRQWPFLTNLGGARRVFTRTTRRPWWHKRTFEEGPPDPARYPYPFPEERPLLLRGYFQAHSTVDGRRDKILAACREPSETVISAQNDARDLAGNACIIGVSFRSSADYRAFGVALPWSYFAQALAIIQRQSDVGAYVLFGDEPADAFEIERLFGSTPFISALNLVAPDQLQLMSTMDHIIIPNSSFAWWGAWLGDARQSSAERIVIAPRPWLSLPDSIRSPSWIGLDFQANTDDAGRNQ